MYAASSQVRETSFGMPGASERRPAELLSPDLLEVLHMLDAIEDDANKAEHPAR